MKSRFPVIRLGELIAAARIRLSYEEPTESLAYLESVTPALNIQEPPGSRQATEAPKSFLKNHAEDTLIPWMFYFGSDSCDSSLTDLLSHSHLR